MFEILWILGIWLAIGAIYLPDAHDTGRSRTARQRRPCASRPRLHHPPTSYPARNPIAKRRFYTSCPSPRLKRPA